MIEVNLIPDVKRELLRVQRTRNIVISVCTLVAIISVGAIVVLGIILGSIQLASGQADNSIKNKYAQLQEKDDLGDLVTIQNQLTQIQSLSDSRGINSRIFDVATLVNPQSPNNVTMSTIRHNFEQSSITIEGTAAGGFNAVDALKKTILNTKIKYNDGSESQEVALASEVTISNTAYVEDANGEKKLSFALTFTYPDALVSNQYRSVEIVSPTGTIDVTDSKTHVPDSLFEASSSNSEEDE